ncbi:MAG: hypothetical protein HRU03_02245 [Nanoarchaeales archaeon]|nr:hypothetical protein [Nanoarchaeales archaeon]
MDFLKNTKKTVLGAVAAAAMISNVGFAEENNTINVEETSKIIRTGTAGGVVLENGSIHKGSLGFDKDTGKIYIGTNNDKNGIFGYGNRQQIGDLATQSELNTLNSTIKTVNDEDQRVKSGVLTDDTLTLTTRDMINKSNGNDIRTVNIDLSALNQADEVSQLQDQTNLNTQDIQNNLSINNSQQTQINGLTNSVNNWVDTDTVRTNSSIDETFATDSDLDVLKNRIESNTEYTTDVHNASVQRDTQLQNNIESNTQYTTNVHNGSIQRDIHLNNKINSNTEYTTDVHKASVQRDKLLEKKINSNTNYKTKVHNESVQRDTQLQNNINANTQKIVTESNERKSEDIRLEGIINSNRVSSINRDIHLNNKIDSNTKYTTNVHNASVQRDKVLASGINSNTNYTTNVHNESVERDFQLGNFINSVDNKHVFWNEQQDLKIFSLEGRTDKIEFEVQDLYGITDSLKRQDSILGAMTSCEFQFNGGSNSICLGGSTDFNRRAGSSVGYGRQFDGNKAFSVKFGQSGSEKRVSAGMSVSW